MESLGYMLVYLLKGRLPWQKIKAKSKSEKNLRIIDKKISTTPDYLCKDLPSCFSEYFKYCRGLQFDEKPDYKFLKSLFKNCFEEFNFTIDSEFDWSEAIEVSL